MNYFKKEALISSVNKYLHLCELSLNDNSSVLISDYGGRVLGLFPRNDSYNLLWINPNISENIKSRSWDIGGDRYWIGPEKSFFYSEPESFGGWHCQEGLDPANYEILVERENNCTVSSPISITNYVSQVHLRGEITRQFKLIKEPIKTGIKDYCGMEYIDDCVIFKPNIEANGWTLTCVISGGRKNPGTVIIPTKSDSKPVSYFRIIPEDRIIQNPDHVSFKIDVDDIYKLGIRPEDIDFSRNSKIGYVIKIPNSEEFAFIVKLSNDVPKKQEDCFDVSRDHPDSEVGVVQSYNSESPNKPSLQFGEIELQLNPLRTIDNTSHGKATHQLCCYIGDKDEILGIIEKYLGVSEPYIFS
ncbi:MAG: DUF6786 family protein [Promethearchaeota archaeon]